MHLSEVKSLVQTHHPHKWLIQTRFQGFQHLAASSSPAGNTRASDNISSFTGPFWGTMKSTSLWSIRVWINDIVPCHRHCLPSPLPAGMQAAKAVLNLQCQASPRHQSPGYPQCLSEPLFWNEGADLSVSYFKGTGHEETHQSLGSDGEEIKSFHQFCCLRVSSTYYEERSKELKVENMS